MLYIDYYYLGYNNEHWLSLGERGKPKKREQMTQTNLKADNGLGLLIVMHKFGGPNTKLGRTLSSPFYDLILL